MCKGYRLCKMVSLAQKFKWPKTCEKRFYKHVRVVLCKKARKKPHVFEKWDHFENRPSCKGYRLCKMVSLAQKLKWPKTCEKRFWPKAKNGSGSTLQLFCAKNRCKKHQIFVKWDHFEIQQSCKGYRLFKMVSLAQKLKWPKTWKKRFCKQVRVVLCKKPLEKTPIIREMRPFWKSAILRRLQTLKNGQF